VISVDDTTVTLVAATVPKFTVAPDKKPVPSMVTAVPPLVGPTSGETLVTVGAGGVAKLYVFVSRGTMSDEVYISAL
jgi:hypothetical protein